MAIDTEAVRPEDRMLARGWAAAQSLDAIVTTDGDADRPLVADETGEWLRGDLLALICVRELDAGTVVTPVNSTTALEVRGLFRNVRRTRIGSPHVIAAMVHPTHLPIVGLEANGGFLLGSPARSTMISKRWQRATLCCPFFLCLPVQGVSAARCQT